MVAEQPTRIMVRRFKDAEWTPGKTVGSHTKWHCPCGKHTFILPDGHRQISPGVVRKADQALDECNK